MLEAFHHPYFNVGRSGIQDEMFRALGRWVNDLEDREQVIGALSEVSPLTVYSYLMLNLASRSDIRKA